MLRSPAIAACVFGLAIAARAADSLPPELLALHAKAENGNVIAQYNLGLAYETGDGVDQDLPEAYVWLSLAREQGSTGKELDVLVTRMSPSAIAEGNVKPSHAATAPR